MVSLLELWLPILLSAVAVFVVSSVIHMALPIHKGDMRKLPGEDTLLAALRAQGVQPGVYGFPFAGSMKEMGTPEMVAKMKLGPSGSMIVVPSCNIGRSLGQWFVLSLVVGAVAGYVAGIALGPGAAPMSVFRVTSSAALLGYGVSHAQDSIWKGLPWNVTAKFFGDGLAYALATGAVFAWLWPAGAGS